MLVNYRLTGFLDEIYATLVVRLHHTVAFQSTDLGKSAADFKTQTGTKLGFMLTRASPNSFRVFMVACGGWKRSADLPTTQ